MTHAFVEYSAVAEPPLRRRLWVTLETTTGFAMAMSGEDSALENCNALFTVIDLHDWSFFIFSRLALEHPVPI